MPRGEIKIADDDGREEKTPAKFSPLIKHWKHSACLIFRRSSVQNTFVIRLDIDTALSTLIVIENWELKPEQSHVAIVFVFVSLLGVLEM